jgi:hypothetical protein
MDPLVQEVPRINFFHRYARQILNLPVNQEVQKYQVVPLDRLVLCLQFCRQFLVVQVCQAFLPDLVHQLALEHQEGHLDQESPAILRFQVSQANLLHLVLLLDLSFLLILEVPEDRAILHKNV